MGCLGTHRRSGVWLGSHWRRDRAWERHFLSRSFDEEATRSGYALRRRSSRRAPVPFNHSLANHDATFCDIAWQEPVGVDVHPVRKRRFQWIALLAAWTMVVACCVHIEAPVHQVVDMSLFGCELQYLLCSFALVRRAARKTRRSTRSLRALHFMSAPVATLLNNGTKVSVAYFML